MILFLCGDVMLGRGIDQALPQPANPELHEDYMRSAVDYLRLAGRQADPAVQSIFSTSVRCISSA